jgi:hypothetical protein
MKKISMRFEVSITRVYLVALYNIQHHAVSYVHMDFTEDFASSIISAPRILVTMQKNTHTPCDDPSRAVGRLARRKDCCLMGGLLDWYW